MALDFPANPTDGQIFNAYTWVASKGAWQSREEVPSTSILSPVKPSTANPGDIWVNTSTGIAFVYYYDGNTYQWMELLSSAVPTVNEIMPIGTIVQTARVSAPTGWLLCQGQSVSRSTYSGLFSAIGTTYGSGDGSTTFAIPNLQGVVPVGKSSSGTFATLGGTGGEEAVTLTELQIPSHTHTGTTSAAGSHTHTYSGTTNTTGSHTHGLKTGQGHDDNNGLNGQGANAQIVQESDIPRLDYYSYPTYSGDHAHTFSGTTSDVSATHTHGFTTGATGGGNAHNNLQPYIILNYMIKV